MNPKADRASLRASFLVRYSDPMVLRARGVPREIYEQIYQGSAPWEIGGPQPAIVELEVQGKIRSRVLDVGCGTGDISIFLASKGYDVLGLDFVEAVIEQAKEKARQQDVAVEFLALDALELASLGQRFATVIDSATFHTFSDEHRVRYASVLASVLEPGAVLHLLCFSDRERYQGGPRHVSEHEIRDCFTDGWEIASMRETRYLAKIAPAGALAWCAEVRRV